MISSVLRLCGGRHLRFLCLAVFGVTVAGCAGNAYPTYPAPETLPPDSPLLSPTLGRTDAWLRHFMLTAQPARALEMLDAESPTAPGDPLLRAMMEALILHQNGEYEASNEAFEWVEKEADLRYTRSISRMGGSLLINDGVMKYTPSPTELRMIPYYRMLNYLALGEMDGAAVEARKAGELLDRLDASGEACGEGALLEYFAGMVRDASGDASGADVSMRRAEHRYTECERSGSVQTPVGLPRDSSAASIGQLTILVEQGFVAHRAEEDLHIPIFSDDLDGLDSDDEDGISRTADRLTTALLLDLGEDDGDRVRSRYDPRWAAWGNSLEGAYVLRLAWPVCRLEANEPAEVRVVVGDTVVATRLAADLSASVRGDLADERPAAITRMVARGIAKYLVSREVEEKAEEEGGELLGFLAGTVANLAANGLEQADTRSWSILPNQISIAEVDLPPGEYPVHIETLGPRGEVIGVQELGTVSIEEGGRSILSSRVWSEGTQPTYRSRVSKARS